jgi:hypothetical protein
MICTTVALALAAQTVSSGLMQSPHAGARAGAVRSVMEAVVPQGQTYVLFDERGSKIATYGSGEPAVLARGKGGGTVTDCAQVPCPSTFDKNTICWKCKKRPAASLAR